MNEPLAALHILIELLLLLFLAAAAVAAFRHAAACRLRVAEAHRELDLLNALVDGVPLPISFKDPQGRYLRCNAAFEKLTGLTEEQILGKTVTEVMPQALAQECRAADAKLLASGRPYSFEAPVLFAGEESAREVMLNKALCYGCLGNVAGIVTAMTDISNHRDLELKLERLANYLQAVVQRAPLAIITCDRNDRITGWNAAAKALFGWSWDEVEGRRFLSVLPVDAASRHDGLDVETVTAVASRVGSNVMLKKKRTGRQGSAVDVLETWVTLDNCEDGDENTGGAIVFMLDIGRQVAVEAALVESDIQSRLVMDSASLASWMFVPSRRLVYGSANLGPLLEQASSTSPFCPLAILKRVAHQDRRAIHAAVRECLGGGADIDMEVRVAAREGKARWLHLRAQFVARGRDRERRLVGIVADISERKAFDDQIYYLAHYDALTGLANRTLMRERLRAALDAAQLNGRSGALMLIDLDGFRTINDTHGPETGDRVLKWVAGLLRGCVGGAEMVGRVGADEFVVLLEDGASRELVEHMAERILEALRGPAEIGGPEVQYQGASIGIAMLPGDGADVTTLMRRADTALQVAKATRRGSCHFFSAELEAHSNYMAFIECQLPLAIRNGHLSMVFQPIYDVKDMRVSLVEALVRWTLPDGRTIAPNEFVPVAERAGLIDDLGRWTLEAAARQAVCMERLGFGVRVAVNLSPSNLASAGFRRAALECIAATGVNPGLIEIEMTEGVFAADRAAIQDAMRFYRSLGMTIAIDDFGTGYSGLSYLRTFPVNTLKIDRSFLGTLDKGGRGSDESILRAVFAIAKQLGLETVAEGVETKEQFQLLKAMGCSRVQGFHLARPMDACMLEELLRGQDMSLPRDALLAGTA